MSLSFKIIKGSYSLLMLFTLTQLLTQSFVYMHIRMWCTCMHRINPHIKWNSWVVWLLRLRVINCPNLFPNSHFNSYFHTTLGQIVVHRILCNNIFGKWLSCKSRYSHLRGKSISNSLSKLEKMRHLFSKLFQRFLYMVL